MLPKFVVVILLFFFLALIALSIYYIEAIWLLMCLSVFFWFFVKRYSRMPSCQNDCDKCENKCDKNKQQEN